MSHRITPLKKATGLSFFHYLYYLNSFQPIGLAFTFTCSSESSGNMHDPYAHIQLTEETVEAYGRVFLSRKDYSSAVCIFKFKIVAFGKTIQNYQSLAKAYECGGEKLKALNTYQEAYKLFPEEKTITERIEYLKSELN